MGRHFKRVAEKTNSALRDGAEELTGLTVHLTAEDVKRLRQISEILAGPDNHHGVFLHGLTTRFPSYPKSIRVAILSDLKAQLTSDEAVEAAYHAYHTVATPTQPQMKLAIRAALSSIGGEW